MCTVFFFFFLNKLKPDGEWFCSQPCLQFSPVNSLKSQPPMSGAWAPRRSLAAGMQIVSQAGISESENKRRGNKYFVLAQELSGIWGHLVGSQFQVCTQLFASSHSMPSLALSMD